jgi:hypothetical protein
LKITIPSKAVIKKLADVFVMETFVVEGPAVRARVNRAHIMTLQRTLRPRQSYISHRVSMILKSDRRRNPD